MARNRVIIETITCDLCGKEIDTAITKRVALDKEAWDLDLCDEDATKVVSQIVTLTANGRRAQAVAASPRTSNAQRKDDWTYLESLGFTRHRGRKTPAENVALAAR